MIRVGTIGTSVITEAFAAAVAETPGIRLEAVSSRDDARARAFADRLQAPRAFGSVDALLASPDVDAVYVGSPNAVHAEQAALAIDAGKHVFVEKPAVATSGDWEALVARAEAAGVVMIEAMRTAYDPGMAAVRAALPEVGVLRRASLHYQKRSSRYAAVLAGETPNIFDPALGGGALADLGVYGLHAAVLLFGEPDAVTAASVGIRTGVDGAGIAVLTYPGLVVDVSYSKITSSSRPSEIQGEDGTLIVDHIASPRALELTRLGGEVTRTRIDGAQDSLRGEVERFVTLVSGGADGLAAAREDTARTAATLRVIERVRAALAG